METTVSAWRETVVLPTYETGKAEKNPMFLEKRVYQGSSGAVYPHPVVEKIADYKTDKNYDAYYIENEYLKIMILPELGGRVHRAYDKVRQRDFVYYNKVIKPALVGLTGPWISGGIEFNWPQHHRPSTFSPLEACIEEHADGSKTVWVNEIEIMSGTKGMTGFTLYPGKAYLEVKGRIYNRTALPQTFLWWANPAVKVNEHYQSIFPPDVYAVFDHGKRDVSAFPVASGTYYKVDYSPGTDISRYKNIPVPTSYMAITSGYDFIGCYEHDTQAGMMHVANHHISPGKKQWTWGNGDFGQAWDRNLTDEDGPYIELMTGMYTDNQPDFSWLQPNEHKSFEQYFMPYAKAGAVKNATKEALINLYLENGEAVLIIYATAIYPGAIIQVYTDDKKTAIYTFDLSPEHVFEKRVKLPDGTLPASIKVTASTSLGELLVSYQPEPEQEHEVPEAATEAGFPENISTTEQLYLTGLHLEQYRHATYNPADYYTEALRRDPSDCRCNNALGLLLLRGGQFKKAEGFFRRAISTLTYRNQNPYDGEAYYNLGWSLQWQEKYDEAYEAFYKCIWNDSWQHSGYLALARIACVRAQWKDAAVLAQQSLIRNYHSPVVRHLVIITLRKTGQTAAAIKMVEETLQLDPFNYACRFEKYILLQQADDVLHEMVTLMRDNIYSYQEYALDYARAGLFKEAETFLLLCAQRQSPLLYYYLAWFAYKAGDRALGISYCRKGALQAPDYCFPSRIEEISILQHAISQLPSDARAPYYLGNLWYQKRQYKEAIGCWESAAALDPQFATVFRNLSLAYFNKQQNPVKALAAMQEAFRLDTSDARVLMELHQLYKVLNHDPEKRLALLEQYPDLVNQRDDLYLEKIAIYNLTGAFNISRELISCRIFHPWEGGEGKVVEQYLLCYLGLAKQALEACRFEEALLLLQYTLQYPDNLGEGKLYGKSENDIHYLQGCAFEGLGLQEEARLHFQKATAGLSEPAQAVFYNDPQPDTIFYQGLAWYKLGEPLKAQQIFQRLLQFGEEHIHHVVHIDYFAVSLPDLLVFEQDLQLLNRVHCYYLQGLGYLGAGNFSKAADYLLKVLKLQQHHSGSTVHLGMIIPFFQKAIPAVYSDWLI